VRLKKKRGIVSEQKSQTSAPKVICPYCKLEGDKVIAAGLPLKLCNECGTLWGEPFAWLYTFIVAPIEGFFNGEFAFFSYQGSYLRGLWLWLTAKDEETF